MRDWWKIGLAISVVVALLYMTAVGALAFISHQTTRRPAEPAPVIHVIEVQDPELATAIMLLGEDRMERQALIDLAENYAKLLGMYSERLVEEMRK